MLGELFDTFFGCWHHQTSFPVSVRPGSARFGSRRSSAASLTGTYVVCLDCGKELPYDWQDMRIISSPSQARNYAQSLATKHAA